MTRLIERDHSNWCTRKEAASANRCSTDTIDRWIKLGRESDGRAGVRSMKDPGGHGVLVYMPDFPPNALPVRAHAS